MDVQRLRSMLLAAIEAHTPKNSWDAALQSGSVLQNVAKEAGLSGDEHEQALLTLFSDLFRTGHLAWGLNLMNPDPPFFHVTETGRMALKSFSRDPANPDGYLHHLSTIVTLNDVAHSYLIEALTTYNSGCFKASAVMIGAATESLVIEIQETLIERLTVLGEPASKDLQSWMIKPILRGIEASLDTRVKKLPPHLKDAYPAYWPAFTEQIRKVRNDSGHPTSIDPVSPSDVQAALLTFPLIASMAQSLRQWIRQDMI